MNDTHTNKIPPHLQPFLQIAHCDLPPQYLNVAKALIEAIQLIDGKIRINKIYQIIVGKSPFNVPVPQNGTFTYKMEKKFICAVIDDYIFIDYLRISRYAYPMQVVCILEELVHALMNAVDHPLTREIVCWLYPDFFVTNEGKYQMHEAPYKKVLEDYCQKDSIPSSKPPNRKIASNNKSKWNGQNWKCLTSRSSGPTTAA